MTFAGLKTSVVAPCIALLALTFSALAKGVKAAGFKAD